MQHLHVGVSLDHDVRHRDLRNAPVAGDLPAHSGHHAELNLGSEAHCVLGNKSNIWRAAAGEVGGGELVEPENAADAAGAVVDGEPEELVGFEVVRGDGADGLSAGEESAVAGEGDWVRGGGGGLGERVEVEGQEFYVGVV